MLAENDIYAMQNPEVTAGKGGLPSLLSRDISPLVACEFASPCGHAHITKLEGMFGGPLGLVNVYALHTAGEKLILWEYLAQILDVNQRWIVGEDWDMVTSLSDHLGPAPHSIGGDELRAWENFVATLELQDFHFETPGEPFYTWDNRRVINALDPRMGPVLRVHRRLDRFYISDLCREGRTEIDVRCLAP